MSIRFTGLVPAVALLVAGAAQAQQATIPKSGAGGAMAYPESLPSGQFKVQAPTERDTGTMAYPNSPGGIRQTQAPGQDTGNMAYPTTGASSSNVGQPAASAPRSRPMTHSTAMDPAVAMRPDVAPTPAQTATARSLETAPSSQPVPYTDFLPPATSARSGRMTGHMMHGHAPMHHMAAKPRTPTAMAKPGGSAPSGSTPTAAGTATSGNSGGGSSSK